MSDVEYQSPWGEDGLWNQEGWAEEYVLFMSKQEPEVIASELRTLLTHCSRKELMQIRQTYEDFYLDGLFLT